MKKLIAFAAAAFIALSQAASAAPVLKAGSSKANLTAPDLDYPIHDSLYTRALVLEAGPTRVAFVSVDFGTFTDEELASKLKKDLDLDALFISSSHTHSGRAAMHNRDYFVNAVDRCVREAAADMREATISSGYRKFSPIAFNRLIMRDNGKARESWEGDDHWLAVNPECITHGPIDPEVGVLRVDEKATGEPMAVIMNFACHPDVVWNNFELSADYVGYATKWVEDAFDGKVDCLFIQGGAGNQAPLFKDGGRQGPDDPRPAKYNLIERMGKLLGIEAARLAYDLYPNPHDVPDIKIMTDSLEFDGRQDKSLHYDLHFSNIVINGNIVIAAIPGEPFIQHQIAWKRDMAPEGRPFLFGYTWSTGGWPNYLPDTRSAALGGFGAEFGPGMIEYGAGDKIYNRLIENHYRLTRDVVE